MNTLTKSILPLAVALAMPIVPFLVIGELPGQRWLSAADDRASLFAVTGAGLLVADVLLPVPSSIVVSLLGGRLGFLPGWAAAWLGLTLGNLVGYGIGRLWPQRLAPNLPERPTLVMLLVSRPVPILAEALTMAAGASRAALIPALAACALGNAVYTGLLTASSASLLAVAPEGPMILLPLLLPALAWAIWRRASRRDPRAEDAGDAAP